MQLVQTEMLRGLLAPVGHGLWTAILGGVLFAASRGEHFRMEWVGLALVSIIGIAWLLVLWRRMPRPVRISPATARSPVVPTIGP